MPSPRPRSGAARGFSLVELLVTLALAGILLAAAGPGFVSMVLEHRIATRTNLLLADLHLARAAAIKRGRQVVICRSRDASRCLRGGGARADWSMGWIIFDNVDGDKDRDPGEPLLQVRTALPEGISVRFNQWWRLIYHGDGGAKNGSFTLCGPRGAEHARALVVYYTGRPRITDRRADGDPLECP